MNVICMNRTSSVMRESFDLSANLGVISIRLKKINIAPGSKVDMYRFEVVRHF